VLVPPPGERQQLVLSLLKTKSGNLKPSYFLTSVQTLCKIECTIIILLFKRFACSPFCCYTHSRRRHDSLTPDVCETFRHTLLHVKSPTRTTFAAGQADRGWPLYSHLSVTTAVDFIQQSGQTGSAQHFMPKFPYSSCQKQNLGCW